MPKKQPRARPGLGRDEINLLPEVNDEVARLLLDRSSKTLEDLLDAKKQFETKAAVLFAAYVTIAVALTGASMLESLEHKFWFVGGGCGFALAAALASWALRDNLYGAIGVEPADWLTRFYLTEAVDHAEAAKLAAVFAGDLQKGIDASRARNLDKANAISAALWISYASGLTVLITAMFEAA